MPGTDRRLSARIPVVWLLTLSFGSLILLSAGSMLVLGLREANQSTSKLLNHRVAPTLSSVVDNLSNHLNPVQSQLAGIAEKIERGELDPQDERTFASYVFATLAATPQITGIALVNEDLVARRYLRGKTRGETDDISVHRDARSNLAAARGRRDSWWAPPRWSHALQASIVTLRQPVHGRDGFMGFIVASVSSGDLSRLVRTLSTTLEQTVFVLYDSEFVLAHPLADTLDFTATPEAPLPTLQQSGDTVLAAIRSDTRKPVWRLALADTQGYHVTVAENDYLFFYRDLTTFGNSPWTVGLYVEQSIVAAEVNRIKQLAWLGAATLLGAVALTVFLGRLLGRPIRRLGEGFGQIERDDLDNVATLPASRVLEIDQGAHAFNRMLTGLRERRLIRELFGHYLPEDIASQLLRNRGALQPQSATATIMFIDIVGFTALSEQLQPQAIVAMLNEYFSTIVAIVESRNGMVTQFQGDAVLVIYNIPQPDPRHARQALESALEIQRVVAGQTFAGQRLSCRIGINTGSVVAGNVGAANRLNYTVHGDAVNIAARLEQLNKEFATDLLLSETTAALLDDVQLQPMGNVPLRGKRQPIAVFTILDDDATALTTK